MARPAAGCAYGVAPCEHHSTLDGASLLTSRLNGPFLPMTVLNALQLLPVQPGLHLEGHLCLAFGR